jgi:SAM-dependent methyltransferase
MSMTGTTDREHWSHFASEWIDWARTPNHDAFWAYRESLKAFIGHGTGEALDIGCGEGRVSRLLQDRGYRVTATDAVADLVTAAAEAGSARTYAVADAGNLPFADSHFDLIVAYNVLMDVDDLPGALREIRRLLRPSGHLVVSIVHPFADRGCFAGNDDKSPFVIAGSYFGRQRFDDVEDHGGLRMHFAGWSQPLENYMAALEGAGLAITSLREPTPDLSEGRERMRRWSRLPLFLWFKARPVQFQQSE